MKEPDGEGVANHTDPESCAGGRKSVGEALTGERAGRVLSSEISSIGMPTLSEYGEGHMHGGVKRESPGDPAESHCGADLHGPDAGTGVRASRRANVDRERSMRTFNSV